MDKIFERFDKRISEVSDKAGPVAQAGLLGIGYSGYCAYRAGRRELPLYVRRHIEALLTMPKESLEILVRRHVPRVFDDEDEL